MSSSNHKAARGFTLIEVMITLSIFAIIAALAAPALSGFIVASRLTTNANDLLGTLGLARAEAVRRGQRVVFCAANASNGVPDTSQCRNVGASSWQGWMIFVDANANGAFDGGEELVRAGAFPAGNTVILASPNLSGAASMIVFRPDGIAKPQGSSSIVQNVALRICDPVSTVNDNARTIGLSFGSRIGVQREAVSGCPAPTDPA